MQMILPSPALLHYFVSFMWHSLSMSIHNLQAKQEEWERKKPTVKRRRKNRKKKKSLKCGNKLYNLTFTAHKRTMNIRGWLKGLKPSHTESKREKCEKRRRDWKFIQKASDESDNFKN